VKNTFSTRSISRFIGTKKLGIRNRTSPSSIQTVREPRNEASDPLGVTERSKPPIGEGTFSIRDYFRESSDAAH
jgi:hypothetical protein